MDELARRIEKIEQRNKLVETDKAWETSKTRRLLIALFTYLSIFLYFLVIGVDKPFLNAIVPTVGFLLSTISLPFVRKIWEKYR
ncbi:MAG: hypothetical protein ACD_25C00232G0002 [uncultured bacterium]|uniref:Uncharacterized protein n=1 Tax=candidate division WWE3 bacterium TaxID=2053526 RepID=A0A656PQ10_UNCKA|nr:hypothetical protein P147_WWE3C00001G0334 [candidate division WWE3 bacterium RAAC2_WWE3_1]EKD94776.1 MAG: hypothetical protein ACD_25C00232G0002 [uncultured bacterium]KKS29682.1 MAG: hypothetical protein UU91_C0004G0074 [candidate division WWE3 bacterium GW2011_GWB1_42_117]KKS55492.1 MAG: hypothetical protein UV21_C0001G0074 [candidate division WWE3 bacterium GW2011_GWD2_42_34]KKT05977.1 MAG: hypothetical protein UV83_C0001G0295 [candidate division WWE3 bacterium GW2011_GWE2_43_18]KKT06895.